MIQAGGVQQCASRKPAYCVDITTVDLLYVGGTVCQRGVCVCRMSGNRGTHRVRGMIARGEYG